MSRMFLMVSMILLIGAVSSQAGIVAPLSATTTITGDAGSHVDYLLRDNAGQALFSLQQPAGTEAFVNDGDSLASAMAKLHQHGGSGHEESWTANTPLGNPVFSFDLGADTSIGSILLWNYGNNGGSTADDPGRNGNSTREFELIFHTDAEGAVFDFASAGGAEAVEFSGTMLRPTDIVNGPTTDDNPAQFFGFGVSETARYVGLRIASNYLDQPGVTAGGDRYGLGEVRFATESVPEPSTFVLTGLLIGFFGWMTRRH